MWWGPLEPIQHWKTGWYFSLRSKVSKTIAGMHTSVMFSWKAPNWTEVLSVHAQSLVIKHTQRLNSCRFYSHLCRITINNEVNAGHFCWFVLKAVYRPLKTVAHWFFLPLEYSDPVSKHGCHLKASSKITECLGQELKLVVKTTGYF